MLARAGGISSKICNQKDKIWEWRVGSGLIHGFRVRQPAPFSISRGIAGPYPPGQAWFDFVRLAAKAMCSNSHQ
jgi:hypothetical protein